MISPIAGGQRADYMVFRRIMMHKMNIKILKKENT